MNAARAASARAVLDTALEAHRGRIVLACSFGGPTGMVLLDMLVSAGADVPVYFLDTELLFPETYALVERVRERYGVHPIGLRSELSVEAQAERYGPSLWARDPDLCCDLRKVRPQRAFLERYGAWITGLRREQSETRATTAFTSTDADGVAKIAPLADWTDADVWSYVLERDVPYNPLNDRGYPSVGCTHCTRAVRPGEDARAGRWAGTAKTECGLHAAAPAATITTKASA